MYTMSIPYFHDIDVYIYIDVFVPGSGPISLRFRTELSPEASYILYELAGDAMTTMTLTHDWEWPLEVIA